MLKKSENMVDKENQWDNIEYADIQDSDDFEEFDDSEFNEGGNMSSSDISADEQEYSEQDYEDGFSDEDDYDDTAVDSGKPKKNNLFIILILVLLLLGVAGFFLIPKNNDSQSVNNEAVSTEQSSGDDISFEGADFGEDQFFSDESSDLVGVNFDDNGAASGEQSADNAQPADNNDFTALGPSDTNNSTADFSMPEESANANAGVAKSGNANDLFSQSDKPIDNSGSNENNDIIISYDKVARVNPFKPPVVEREKEIEKSLEKLNTTGFEIVEPPVASVPDENLTRLLQTQVSGILYDEESPSAIVNLNGIDTFVKIGDTMSGYKIQMITKDKVQINYKNNSYVASVGALFVKGMIESKPAVANLEKKFAGRYKDN